MAMTLCRIQMTNNYREVLSMDPELEEIMEMEEFSKIIYVEDDEAEHV